MYMQGIYHGSAIDLKRICNGYTADLNWICRGSTTDLPSTIQEPLVPTCGGGFPAALQAQ